MFFFSSPLWTGHLYPVRSSAPGLPGYWQRALADLERDVGRSRAFFAPGTDAWWQDAPG